VVVPVTKTTKVRSDGGRDSPGPKPTWRRDAAPRDHLNLLESSRTLLTLLRFGSIDYPIAACNEISRGLVRDNEELQWSEGWYRGYFELHITKEKIDAQFFGNPSLQTRNGYEVSLANFTVANGANRLSRPVAGGLVEDGALKDGDISMSKLTYDTNTGKYFVHDYKRVTLVTDY
jgi:hypothetical protein